jgi:hypothetical protein
MRNFVVSFALVFFGGTSVAGAVPAEWSTASGGNGHLYEVTLVHGTSWDSARTASLAKGSGWDLASITSQAEQDFIITLLPGSPFHREQLWLGGHDSGTEDVWEWSNGDAFSYTNWWNGEPNDHGGEDYLTMDYRQSGFFHHHSGEWKWNDLSGGSHYVVKGYVSEFSNAIPEPSTGLLVASGLIGLGLKRQQHLNQLVASLQEP